MPDYRKFLDKRWIAFRKALWRSARKECDNTKVAMIFGAQRSGTTMLLDCLERSMEIEVLGELSKAMTNVRIRSRAAVQNLVRRSPHRLVVLKPLTDSHRVVDLLGWFPKSKAIWAFRRVEDRVNSSVAKFGSHNLHVLRQFAARRGLDTWQAQGLDERDFEWLAQFDLDTMTPHVASAIFWRLRNELFFKQDLQERDDVLPVAYEDLASAPAPMMKAICDFIGAPFDEDMVSRVHARSIGRQESVLPSEIVDLCTPLYERLHDRQKQLWTHIPG